MEGVGFGVLGWSKSSEFLGGPWSHPRSPKNTTLDVGFTSSMGVDPSVSSVTRRTWTGVGSRQVSVSEYLRLECVVSDTVGHLFPETEERS